MTIVSFSGIDGAGKSTQISALEAWLNESGLRTTLLTFWDNVVCFSRSREFMSLKAFKGDAGVGSPEKPLQRRDKNVIFMASYRDAFRTLFRRRSESLHTSSSVQE